jgi:hypothetical protein
LTDTNNPHLAPHAPEPATAPGVVAEGKALPPEPTRVDAPPPVPTPVPTPTPSAPTTAPAATPQSIDVVDPEAFNRQNHPEKYPGKP